MVQTKFWLLIQEDIHKEVIVVDTLEDFFLLYYWAKCLRQIVGVELKDFF